ncbi:MAG: hypothetical protein IKN55_06750 [Oscillospiraceae bacterium]|nr:hypothetical protein [Oscillospiraceae bacterium]
MEEKRKQLETVLKNPDFVIACLSAEDEETVQQLFAGMGIEMSLNEIEIMKEMIEGVADGDITEKHLDTLANGGELTEEMLEGAAGGDFFFNYFNGAGGKISKAAYLADKQFTDPTIFDGTRSLAPGGYATIALGVITVGGIIAQASGVDVIGGIKEGAVSGYEWCKEKITSRW